MTVPGEGPYAKLALRRLGLFLGSLPAAGEEERLLRARMRHLVRVEQPLVLITQVARSGGTLLARLLDDDPYCHVVGHELGSMLLGLKRLGVDVRSGWRALTSMEPVAPDFTRRQSRQHLRGGPEEHAFFLSPRLQRAIFERRLAGIPAPSERDIVDCYMTAYFNAWLDYRNLRLGDKRWIIGFEPGAIVSSHVRDAFRRVYPDGRVISIVRDPWSWYVSASREPKRTLGLAEGIARWSDSARAALAWREAEPGSVLLLRFDRLLTHTEETMRWVAAWLGIEFAPSLVRPTFNGLPIVANSSFADVSLDVSTAPLERRAALASFEDAVISEQAGELYDAACRAADECLAGAPPASALRLMDAGAAAKR